ncbi:hypothetical protein HUT16_18545 [Kitasatospora sp. NA04385]|uniref:DUF5819 family protein n=1 Tax=Kitasatospora sp. NA04385 TaxID=2742135 RepID=UPI0015929FA8|nr:DUF5819 family protein [Kitasatospora sp. NA04385]QKW20795.1 hypothetical protein HUT16_18545 [Kitasatospora sp. NA04385]
MRVWSTPARVVLVVAGAGLAVCVLAFLGALFLHVAPANSVSTAYRAQVDWVVYPEFEQNWKLFAPDPLQRNVEVDARVQTIGADGQVATGDWHGLTAGDWAAIRHDPAPSHLDQNLLRRAWDFYESTHGDGDAPAPAGSRGRMAEQYLERIALQRIGSGGDRVIQVQLRATITSVAPPSWSREQVDTAPHARELPWWPVQAEDRRGLS